MNLFFIAAFEEAIIKSHAEVLRNQAELKYGQAKLEREVNFCQHMLRKLAADKKMPPEEIEMDAVSRYIPCYNMGAVRELEANLQSNDEFKKNLVSLLCLTVVLATNAVIVFRLPE